MTDRRSIVFLSFCFLIYHFSTTESRMISEGVDSSGGCKFKNKFYGVGEQWFPPGVCQVNTCLKGGAIGKKTCFDLGGPDVCERVLEEDLTKSYPDCCGPFICPSFI